ARSEELALLLIAGPLAGEGHSLGSQDAAMDEVRRRVADEGVAREVRAEQLIPVDRPAAGRVEVDRAFPRFRGDRLPAYRDRPRTGKERSGADLHQVAA